MPKGAAGLIRIVAMSLLIVVLLVFLLKGMWLWLGGVMVIASLSGTLLWLIQRTLPQTAGVLTLAGLEDTVSVSRDQWGVPSIIASTLHDVAFAQGYITAQDRLFQMALHRQIAQGRLAEMFGSGPHNQLVESDRYLRTLNLYRLAVAEWAITDPRSKLELQAYADGVNAFIMTHKRRLPLEFLLLGVTMEPWQPIDSLAYGRVLALSLMGNWRLAYVRAMLQEKLGETRVGQLFPPYPSENPSLLTDTEDPSVHASAVAIPPTVEVNTLESGQPAADSSWSSRLLQAFSLHPSGISVVQALLDPPAGALGSNAWVVDGTRTVTGKPLLASDPHLGISMPAIWYQIALRGGELDVIGYSLPGIPGVMIGRNAHLSWGISYAEADVTTLYRETLDPVAHPGHYLYAGQWLPLDTREEIIRVKGKKKTLSFTVLSTKHGPLLNESAPDLKSYAPLAMRWTALEPIYTSTGFFQLNFARNWSQFREALRTVSLNMNFVYADSKGNIGYCMSGMIPLRSGESGLLPVDGSSGDHEWTGYVPSERMPTLFNPSTHLIVTANHRVIPSDDAFHITHTWDPGYRARRIGELLNNVPRLGVTDYQRIQADVYSIPASLQTPYFVRAGRAHGGDAALAAQLLQSWDYHLSSESVAAAVYEVITSIFLRETLEPLLGKDLYNLYARIYFACWRQVLLSQLLSNPVDDFFGEHNHSAVGNHADDLSARRDAALAHAMQSAIGELRATLGADSARWQWGTLHKADFAHPMAGQGPLHLLFGLKPLARPGDSVTVNVGGAEGFALDPPKYEQIAVASMRMIVDLADWDHSLWTLTTGQSGQPFSRHYHDQVARWDQNLYQPMKCSAPLADTKRVRFLSLRPSVVQKIV